MPRDQKYIIGHWNTKEVYFGHELLDPAESLSIINHSPDGFNWSYAGSGPAQLALAILLKFLPESKAVRLYQEFKDIFIATLGQHNFYMPVDTVTDWIAYKLSQKGGQGEE